MQSEQRLPALWLPSHQGMERGWQLSTLSTLGTLPEYLSLGEGHDMGTQSHASDGPVARAGNDQSWCEV